MTTLTKTRIAGMFAAVVAGVGLMAAGTAQDPQAELNKEAPDFTITDVTGKEHTLSSYTEAGKVVVLEWFNPDCPVVKARYENFEGDVPPTIQLEKDHADKVVWLRINSGAEGKQGAGVERNKKAMTDFGIETPILLDMSGKVGKAYGAKVTPEMYVIDGEGVLRYHGAIDSNQGKRDLGDDFYLKSALQSVLAGETVATQETRAQGCGIKYGS
ncbi:MAG: redoxin domain-containing protein [Phycisphaerales bacterium JB040]